MTTRRKEARGKADAAFRAAVEAAGEDLGRIYQSEGRFLQGNLKRLWQDIEIENRQYAQRRIPTCLRHIDD